MSGTAVLSSGGMDSCVLLAKVASESDSDVFPIYVETGMLWEKAEQLALQRFISALENPAIHPIVKLLLPVRPLYGTDHWSMDGRKIPEYNAPDETVYIPGRNIVLITLASIWCSLNGVHRIAIGSLAGNPFPDATPSFFDLIAKSNSAGLGHSVEVVAPLREMHKEDLLIKYGAGLPLHLTLTCANPFISGDDDSIVHCGGCNKCRERHEAFMDAGLDDDTEYAKALS